MSLSILSSGLVRSGSKTFCRGIYHHFLSWTLTIMAFDSEEKLEQICLGMAKKPTEEDDNMEEDWDLIPEFTLKSVVLIHNQIFGSHDLVKQPGICHISDEDRLQSFMQSYEVGTRIMKGLQPLTSSKLDNNLMPEHLLRLSLEYEQISGISSRPTHSYNIYKDPNPSVMFKMVKPVSFLQIQVKHFLDERPEHPGLQRIFDITESPLAMPLNSSLSKALLGLQLLVGRAQFLQENDSKYSFKDHLQSIYALVSPWQKLEIECWPALLDGVQEQYEINAEKLWFPLRAVIRDVKDQSLFTIKTHVSSPAVIHSKLRKLIYGCLMKLYNAVLRNLCKHPVLGNLRDGFNLLSPSTARFLMVSP